MSNTLDQPAGQIGHLLDWWLRPAAGLDRDRPAAPHQVVSPPPLPPCHRLDDDPAEIRSFLEQTGFAHVPGVSLRGDGADQRRHAHGQRTHTKGRRQQLVVRAHNHHIRLVRMRGFQHHSTTATASAGRRAVPALGRLAGCGHQFGGFADSKLEALFKPLGVVSGISHIPWHKDCSRALHLRVPPASPWASPSRGWPHRTPAPG